MAIDVLAVVMARAGSVGLPGKAMRELLGRPVIAYTLDHVREAKRVSRVVVTSDDAGVLGLARAQGFEVVDRPAELASGTAKTDDVLRHAVKVLRERQPLPHGRGSDEGTLPHGRVSDKGLWRDPDAVVMLYGNVPIRAGGMIDKCLAMLEETHADSVQTIAAVGKMHPYWMFDRDGEGRIRKHVKNDVYRRQDLPALYSPTGAVYVMKTNVLMESEGSGDPHAFLGRDRRGLIVGAEESVDIDSAKDLFVAEAMLRWMQMGGGK